MLGMAALLLAGVFWPYRGYEGRAVVVIEQGMSRRAMAARLAERGVVWSRWAFLAWAYAQPWRTLKAGEYDFDRPMSAAAVVSKLVRGEIHLYALVVPEGWTRWDIAGEVERLGLASRAEFLRAAENAALVRDLAPQARNLEGYLFPETYQFARPSDPAEIVRVLVERFRREYAALARDAPPQALSTHELVALASLVEKETSVARERGLVASVYLNRLARRMKLDCDPTVIYTARLAHDGYFDGAINVSDLERQSPYNTYLHAGLPPGPIASPGRAALEAVLRPPKTKYLFFVSNTRGGHFFAATDAEHGRNVARFRRLRAQQQSQPGPSGNRQ
jgi:UPF0755 protein